MIQVVLVFYVLVVIAMIAVILIQKSEGGGLGLGSGGGMSGFMTGRGTANLLTRTTSILAALFMATSVLLAVLGGHQRSAGSILDQIPATGAPATAPATLPAPEPAAPAPPQAPAVPLAK